MNNIGRNDPCPCGSGKKYKQCCVQRDGALAASKIPNAASAREVLQAALEHHQAGRLPQAEALYQQILQVTPNHPDALHLLGALAHQVGKNEIAVELISKAIGARPSSLMHYNLGLALNAQGKLDAAVASYRNALLLKPDYAEAHNNLGLALQAQGKFDEAVKSYRRALLRKPDYVEAHNNLGNALQAQGKLNEAAEQYHKAIQLKPDYAEAYYNAGLVLRAQGLIDMAIVNHQRALQLSASPENKIGFAQSLRNASFTHEVPGIRSLVIQAVSEPWERPGELVAASISLIKLNQDIRECIDRAANAWPIRLAEQELFGRSGLASASGDLLLQCLLENAPASNVDMERFLTMARLALLDTAKRAVVSDVPEARVLTYCCALARQCFINEYVFAHTEEEFDQARLLREQLVAALASGLPVPVLWLVAVAAYFPLISLPSAATLPDQSWPEPVAALLQQQVREPLKERQLRIGIPSLTPVEDEVSRLVQQQYEENPYPRWIKSPPCFKATAVDVYMREHFPLAPFKPVGHSDKVDVLIAGCGTGQHSIQTAQQFRGARVLAIDLSLSSLGYAKRKTRELGLTNIEYAQADIMKLETIDRTFDVIESVGVLHHLADPMAGWRNLVSLLRPGGFMRLGFYSELARQGVVAIRDFIAEQGYASSAEDIRRCRQDLMTMEDDLLFKQLTSSPEFYSTSDCRDLLFHVQEHRLTLPQLKEYLGELGLDFIGFSLEPNIMKQYAERFPDDPSKTNLDYWNTFETENPNTFTRMYRFWVQKRG